MILFPASLGLRASPTSTCPGELAGLGGCAARGTQRVPGARQEGAPGPCFICQAATSHRCVSEMANSGSVVQRWDYTGVENTEVPRERTAHLGSQGWDEQLCRTRGHSPLRAKGKCSKSPNSASCSTAGPWPATGARGFWRDIPAGLATNSALCRRWGTPAGLHRHRHHHGWTARTAGSPGARGATR